MAPTGSAKVIINGGGIAGLVLANALSRQGIDFLVLEAGTEIAPCVGAGICVLPSGARILDQLGVFDDLRNLGEIHAQRIWREDGSLLGHTDSLQLIHVRQGYPVIFVERRALLQVLFDHLKEKDRVLLRKRIVGIESSDSQVNVRCTDGSSYTGCIAVGADGIHSMTRTEMWRHLEKDHMVGISSVENEEKTLSAQYSAVFGLATPTPNMVPGHVNRTFANGYSFFDGVGNDGRVFWFVFHDMGKKYQGLDIPRMNQSEIDQHLKPLLDNYVSGGVRFRDIYKNTIRCAHVPMEEGVFDRWAYQRFACIGDSVHKTTPNLGQGGNGAMESAASLANTLESIFSTKEVSHPPLAVIEGHLDAWAKSRMQRMKLLCEFGNDFTRLEAGETFIHRLLGRWIATYKGDTLADLLCETTVGAETLSFLPLPAKSLEGTMPFDKRRGMGASKEKYGPLMYCSATLLCILALHFTMKPNNTSSMHTPQNNTQIGGNLEVTTWNFGSTSVENVNHHTGSLGLWQNLQLADPAMAIAFFMDLAIFEAIWTMEGIRSGNAITLLNWSLPFSLMSHLNGGMNIAAPLYFTICHFQSPVSILKVPDCRTIRQSYVKVLIPSLMVGYYAPAIGLAFKNHDIFDTSSITLLLLPLIFRLIHYAVASCLVDTTIQTRMKKPTADMSFIRATYILCSLISGVCHMLSRSGFPYPFLPWHNGIKGRDFNIAFASAMIWLCFEYKDLKSEGRLSWSWVRILSISVLATCTLGPTGALMLGWGMREECLATFERRLSETESKSCGVGKLTDSKDCISL